MDARRGFARQPRLGVAARLTAADVGAVSRGVDRALGVDQALGEDWPQPDDPGPEPGLAAFAASYTPVDWAAAFARQPEDTDWLVDGFLERGTLNALFAKPGTGKSLLALETAVGLVRGGSTVVYLDEENRLTDLVDRLQAFGCTPGELERLRLYSFARLPPLDTNAGGRDLLALAVTCGAALVVLDTGTRMVAGSENDSDTFQALYYHALSPLKAKGITVLRLDHPGKDEGRGQRGSSAKDEDVDTTWRLSTVVKGRQYRLERPKGRSGNGPDAWTLHRRYEPLRHEWERPRRTAPPTPTGSPGSCWCGPGGPAA